MIVYARGTIVLSTGQKLLKLTKEKVNIRAGLLNKNLPTLDSSKAWQAAVFGRGREIILEGWFAGTQSEIELFLKFFEDWVNDNASFQLTGQYYPMFNKDNLVTPGEGFWNVMCGDFEYNYDDVEPTMIRYAITMREGTKIGGYSGLSGAE